MEIEITTLVFWGAVTLIILCIILAALRFRTGQRLYVSKRMMTEHELAFFHKLSQASRDLGDYTVMSQVSMGAFIQTRHGLSNGDRQRAWNAISQKIVDFVLMDRKGNVALVVELDDATHSADKDRARDTLVAKAGFKTERFRRGFKITVGEITEQLEKSL